MKPLLALPKFFLIFLMPLLFTSYQQKPVHEVRINLKDSSRMVWIPEGEFAYGLNSQQWNNLKDKYGSDIVNYYFLRKTIKNLKGYFIDRYEITNAQFLKFINKSGHKVVSKKFNATAASRNPRLPVTNVGWPDARAYAQWANKKLPSEEQWEKAARGPNGYLWPWGDKDSGNKYNGANQGKYAPVKVGSFPAGKSGYGAMDMAGNVYEMTTGKWLDDDNAMRGGSYLNRAFYTMGAFRWAADDTTNGASWLGFRCVKEIP